MKTFKIGNQIYNMNEEERERKPVSLWWTFVPIFFGALGGIVAWRLTKHKHNEMALCIHGYNRPLLYLDHFSVFLIGPLDNL